MIINYFVEAKDVALGRLASKIAGLITRNVKSISNKDKLAIGVVNIREFKLTGRKNESKRWFWHSNYPGGIKSIRIQDLLRRSPKEVLIKAISGMVPKNKPAKKALQFVSSTCSIR